MVSDAIINELSIEFNTQGDKIKFEKMVDMEMRAITIARDLIDDDQLMGMIINPIAISIMNAIAILIDDDDLDAIDQGIDKIEVIIMDSFAD